MTKYTMMKNNVWIYLMAIFWFYSALAQEQEPYLDMGFLIIHSTEDYRAALQVANEASTQLGVKIDLRGYDEDPEMGLTTLTPCCEFHDYIPRGRYDGGDYISIELGEPFRAAEKYVVIIASAAMSGEAEKDLKKLLSKAKKFYKDAYVKEVKVYTGCIH